MAETSRDKPPRRKRTPRARPADPVRPARPFGHSLADFEPLRPLEHEVLQACAGGSVAKGAGRALRGETPSVRGEFLRFLILGGDERAPVHGNGVRLAAMNIEGRLDLTGCAVLFPILFVDCHFDHGLILNDASLVSLVLGGSRLEFVDGDRLRCSGEIRLDHVRIVRGLSLVRSELNSDLNLTGARLVFEPYIAHVPLSLDEAKINGSLFLVRGFAAHGEVRLKKAQIAGSLLIVEAKIDNGDRFGLIADRVEVKGDIVFHEAEIIGGVTLAGARAGALIDDVSKWRPPVVLDGFDYQRIGAGASIDVAARIEWLRMQPRFEPGPWEHLYHVLRRMRRGEEATRIAIAKQRERRRLGLVGGRPVAGVPILTRWRNRLLNGVERALHRSYGALAGYGHRKVQGALWAAIGFWLAAGIAFMAGSGYIGPTSGALIEHRDEWRCGYRGEPGRTEWTRCRRIPPEYARFQPLIYSADLILPFLDLQQEEAWAPIVSDAAGDPLLPGRALRMLMWLEMLFGWAVVGYLVSLIGKLAGKEPEG